MSPKDLVHLCLLGLIIKWFNANNIWAVCTSRHNFVCGVYCICRQQEKQRLGNHLEILIKSILDYLSKFVLFVFIHWSKGSKYMAIQMFRTYTHFCLYGRAAVTPMSGGWMFCFPPQVYSPSCSMPRKLTSMHRISDLSCPLASDWVWEALAGVSGWNI